MKITMLRVCVLFILAFGAAAQDSKPLAVTSGQEFNITLASNPTTGYKWDLAKPLDSKLVTLITNQFIRPDTRLVGAGGKEIWTFKAVGEGKTQIDLKYIRPWEKDVDPARKTNIAVTISGK
jgi:inhibitor of cysteine peptidase